jgi:uncharacterized protein YkwD
MSDYNPHKTRSAAPQKVRAAATSFILLAIAALGFTFSAMPAAAAPMSAPALETAVLSEMNIARAQNHRAPLRMLNTLTTPARAQSRYLLKTGLLSHDSRDGTPFWTRLQRAGFPRTRAMGENLVQVGGCNESTARLAVQLWMHSPDHKANLLDKRFHVTGVGVSFNASCDVTVITADYGS